MRRTGRGKKHPLLLSVAGERIHRLYELSFESLRSGDLERARRYTTMARRISMRTTRRIPTHLKRSTCKGCMSPLIPGLNARVRIHDGRNIITCLDCGEVRRFPFKPKKPMEGSNGEK